MTTIEYNKRKYNLTFQEYHPPLWDSFWANEGYFETYRRIMGTDVGFIYIVRNGEFTGFMQADGPEEIDASVRDKLSGAWLDSELKKFEKLFNELRVIIETSRRNPAATNVEDRLRKVHALLGLIYPYSNSFYMLSHAMEKKVHAKLVSQYGGEKANAIMVQSATPLKETTLIQYFKDIRTIASRLKRKNVSTMPQMMAHYQTDFSFQSTIRALQEKYFCLTSINSEERTKESFFPDIFAEMQKEKKVVEQLHFPPEVAEEIHILRGMVYLKDEISTFIIPYVKFGLKNDWDFMAKKWKLTREEMDQLLIEEVLGMTPVENMKKLANERRKATFFLHEPPHMNATVLSGSKAEKEIQLVMSQISSKIENVSEIKGTIGCAGKAQGIVQKIYSSKEISKFKEGNVLVTVYTAPEFVPAMNKAVAIVTDTGGITSHAAIVSRELGKPCIVGAKIAMSALNDGDLVEVDANTGVIRKLKV